MGSYLSKPQKQRLRQVAPAVLLLWRRVIISLLIRRRLPAARELLETLLYSGLLSSPVLLPGVWAQIRDWTGLSERQQTMIILGVLQYATGLIPPIATLIELSTATVRNAAQNGRLPFGIGSSVLGNSARGKSWAEFALIYFCSFSLILLYNEFPVRLLAACLLSFSLFFSLRYFVQRFIDCDDLMCVVLVLNMFRTALLFAVLP